MFQNESFNYWFFINIFSLISESERIKSQNIYRNRRHHKPTNQSKHESKMAVFNFLKHRLLTDLVNSFLVYTKLNTKRKIF